MEEEKDTRLIFIEAIEPFIDRDTYSQITANIDIIEERLARQGYWGHLCQKLQAEIEQLRIEREAAAGYANQKISENEALKEVFESLHTTITLGSKDWATCKRDAWIYGIIVGWGDASYEEFKERMAWSEDLIKANKDLHEAVKKFNKYCGL